MKNLWKELNRINEIHGGSNEFILIVLISSIFYNSSSFANCHLIFQELLTSETQKIMPMKEN